MRKPYKSHKSPEHETTIDDEVTVVRYDYDPGEEEWFDARAGVGSPGYGPSLEITEICDEDGNWHPVTGDELWYSRVEDEIMDAMIEKNAADDQDQYESYQADQEYWKQIEANPKGQ
jgi:hypothetical protein